MTPLTLRLSARIAFLLSNAAAAAAVADVASVILLRSRSPSLNLLCTVVPILFANGEGTFADDDDSAFSEDATSIPSPSSSDLMETAQNERSSRRRDCK